MSGKNNISNSELAQMLQSLCLQFSNNGLDVQYQDTKSGLIILIPQVSVAQLDDKDHFVYQSQAVPETPATVPETSSCVSGTVEAVPET